MKLAWLVNEFHGLCWWSGAPTVIRMSPNAYAEFIEALSHDLRGPYPINAMGTAVIQDRSLTHRTVEFGFRMEVPGD